MSRSYLRQVLRRTQKTQQIVILDLVISASSGVSSAANWIEDLQCGTEYGQCLIVTQTPIHKSEVFSKTLLESLVNANSQVGLPVAQWITQLQKLLQGKGINLHTWLSGTQAIIDILPGNISQVLENISEKHQNTLVQTSQNPPKSTSNFKIPSAPQKNLILTSEKYTELESLLKQSIGIIASPILQQSLKNAANNQQLIATLATYISPEKIKQFKNQATAILEISSTSTQSRLAKSPTIVYQAIDSNFVSKCERDLIYLIGPIANFIIEEILQDNPQISATEFVEKLSQNIPDSLIAVEFKQRILKK